MQIFAEQLAPDSEDVVRQFAPDLIPTPAAVAGQAPVAGRGLAASQGSAAGQAADVEEAGVEAAPTARSKQPALLGLRDWSGDEDRPQDVILIDSDEDVVLAESSSLVRPKRARSTTAKEQAARHKWGRIALASPVVDA